MTPQKTSVKDKIISDEDAPDLITTTFDECEHKHDKIPTLAICLIPLDIRSYTGAYIVILSIVNYYLMGI